MPLKRLFFFWILTLTSQSNAATDIPLSLFHTPTHLEEVQRNRLRPSAPLDKGHTSPQQTHIRLDGLMYISPTSWRLWINGKAYHKDTFPTLKVQRVTATHATFSWNDRGTTHTFTLAPSHSFPHKKPTHD